MEPGCASPGAASPAAQWVGQNVDCRCSLSVRSTSETFVRSTADGFLRHFCFIKNPSLFGTTIDKLVMKACIDIIYNKAKPKSRRILRARRFFSTADFVMQFKAHVLGIIESYVPAIYHAAPSSLEKVDGFQISSCHTWISMRKTDFYIMVWHRWYCAETLVCLVCFTNALTIRLTQNCASCSAVRHSKDFLAMPLGGVAASTDFNWRSSQTVINEWRFPDLCLAW